MTMGPEYGTGSNTVLLTSRSQSSRLRSDPMELSWGLQEFLSPTCRTQRAPRSIYLLFMQSSVNHEKLSPGSVRDRDG